MNSRASLQVRDQPGALDEASLRFLALSDELLAITGFDGRLKWANPAHERLIGWSNDELIDRPYIDLFHPEDRERLVAEAAHASSGGSTPVSFEARLRCKDGSHRWFQITTTPSSEEELAYTVARAIDGHSRGDNKQTAGESPFMELSLDPMLVVDFDGLLAPSEPGLRAPAGLAAAGPLSTSATSTCSTPMTARWWPDEFATPEPARRRDARIPSATSPQGGVLPVPVVERDRMP